MQLFENEGSQNNNCHYIDIYLFVSKLLSILNK